MSKIKVGQVLWLKANLDNTGLFSDIEHPYLVLDIFEDDIVVVEIGQLDSVKPYELFHDYMALIRCEDPRESVINKDSYLNLNKRIRLEYYDGLVHYLRSEQKLSEHKLEDVLIKYRDYQEKNAIDEQLNMFFTKREIEEWNFD